MSNKLYKEKKPERKRNLLLRLWLWLWEDLNHGQSWKAAPRWLFYFAVGLFIWFIIQILSGEVPLF